MFPPPDASMVRDGAERMTLVADDLVSYKREFMKLYNTAAANAGKFLEAFLRQEQVLRLFKMVPAEYLEKYFHSTDAAITKVTFSLGEAIKTADTDAKQLHVISAHASALKGLDKFLQAGSVKTFNSLVATADAAIKVEALLFDIYF